MAKKGPELWYAGSKFQKAWLGAWLQDPQPIRPMKFNSLTETNPGDHAKLSGGDAAAVTDFLMSLTSKDVEAGVIKPKRNPRRRLTFTKTMPCTGCHQSPAQRKKLTGARRGPPPVGAGARGSPGRCSWFAAGVTIRTEVGVNVAPVIASAGVVGLASGFGAQTLVKDAIAGLFLLLENHYDMGDRVKLNNVEGTVIGVSLRRTTLQSDDGAVHTIPNGSIALTTNISAGARRPPPAEQ